jgi:hypothetical protein
MNIICFAPYSAALRLLFILQRCHSSSPYDRRHRATEDDINDTNKQRPFQFHFSMDGLLPVVVMENILVLTFGDTIVECQESKMPQSYRCALRSGFATAVVVAAVVRFHN